MVKCSSGVFDAVRLEELFNLVRNELLAVVGDDLRRQTPSREQFLKKADHGARYNSVDGTHLWPFEVIVCDDEVAPARRFAM